MRRSAVVLLLLGACASTTSKMAPAPPQASHIPSPAVRSGPPDAAPTEGSLWDDRSTQAYLFTALRASRVGDLLTVRIVESASAGSTANTATTRDSSLALGVPNLFGLEKKGLGGADPASLLSASTKNSFAGKGSTNRTGRLAATISARVTDVLENGNMVVEASREMIVNNENQIITLWGIVRPVDIDGENTVPSTAISDLRVTFGGSGTVARKQKEGIGHKVLDWIWPF
jgi:flagellar L-ring protein FlgH